MEQLQRKKETHEDLDAKILPLSNEESELESDVIESAELLSALDEHIAQIKFLLTTHKPAVTPPVSMTDLASVPVSPSTVSSTEPLGDTPLVVSDTPLESSSIIHPVVSEESLVTSSAATNGTPPVVSNTSPAVSYTASPHSISLSVLIVPPPTFTHPPVTAYVTHSTHGTAPYYTASRLPKLTIPMFNGDPLSWQSFWDCFDLAVHSNPNLTGYL